MKIIGYFILGSFAFNFNLISIPLGFIVYLLLFRPKLNVDIKRTASVLGFLTFIVVQWLLPFANLEWQSNAVSIEHKLGSVYSINFQEEYERIRHKLDLENNSLSLQDFVIEYNKNGTIRDLHLELISTEDNGLKHYTIQYNSEKNRYQVLQSQLDNWLQYDRLVDADLFFKNLGVLNIQDITRSKGDYSYYVVRGSGEWIEYDSENQASFMVKNGKIQEVNQDQLPVEGYYVATYAMKKTHEEKNEDGNIIEEAYESTESTSYLFEVSSIE
ncbi:hypothetical protein [Bacillus sp. FJAT-18017]|uniref:hypothetical protein n=1 Tax=Bacillus sp. FJAT-18017 TaxID=1705566 RepID=UPI0012E1E39D|nr:hypothetical protein [Bacillus sp. FJAT-18017]